MHENSMQEMMNFKNKYLAHLKGATILDVGSRRLRQKHARYTATYREIFEPDYVYTGMDVAPGHNVDIVGFENLKGPYDVVISGQTMEHLNRPWEWLRSLVPLFKIYICIIAPNEGREHRYPIDTYRYFPDGMRDLFDYARIKEISIYKSAWDTVGIGKHYV